MDCRFVVIFLCLGLSLGQAVEVKSYSVSLLRNGKSGNFNRTSEFDNNSNNNNRLTNVAQTAHRSVVNVLEEKQQMLESDLSKLKEHLTKLEWKVEGFQGQRKQTEKATEDIRWAVGSLKKSILNIENDVVQFKLSQKNSVTSQGQGHDLVTSLEKKVTTLEEENRRKEAEIKQMWTLIKSLSEDKNNDVRHNQHHHHHNHQQQKQKSTNFLTGNEIPSLPSSSSSSSSFSSVVTDQWVARLMNRLASVEGAVQDLNRRQQIDKRNLAEQEELLLEKFDHLQEKMLRMKDEIHDLEDGRNRVMTSFGNKELRCFTKATSDGNSVNTSSSKETGEEMEVLLKDLSGRRELENLWKRMEAIEGKILVLQLNSTVNQSRDVNHDLKLRLDLAHVAFQASELTNQMFLLRSTVNRIARELKILKETSNNFHETNQIPGSRS